MHTYEYEENRSNPIYRVSFMATGLIRHVKNFETEAEAAAYVSYLNGGGEPPWLQKNESQAVISPEYAAELGRQVDELEKENLELQNQRELNQRELNP